MKFARVLRATSGDMPEMQELLACYESLKQLMKAIPANSESAAAESSPPNAVGTSTTGTTDNWEHRFETAITSHLNVFNNRWEDREETCIIRIEAAQDQVATATSIQEKLCLRQYLLDFHGELLLLMHWSILAYTGLVKIMKKYYKHTGQLIRAPSCSNLLSQPFCSTEVMSNMVSRVELTLQQLQQDVGFPEDVTSEQVLSTPHLHVTSHACAQSATSRPGSTSINPQQVDATRLVPTEHANTAEYQTDDCRPPKYQRVGESNTGPSVSQSAALPDTAIPSEAAANCGIDPESAELSDDSDDGIDNDLDYLARLMREEGSGIGRPGSHQAAGGLGNKTRLALSTWRHLQNNSATPSTIFPATRKPVPSAPCSLTQHSFS